MNWTDVFPLLDDAMVDEYEATATKKERKELADWFAVQRVINPRDTGHIISVSLFWKNIRSHQPDILIKDRAMFMGIGRRRKLLRFDPWDHYAQPLIKGALWLQANRPDVTFRVYLAADLEFLIPDLVVAGCEVHLMKSSSIRHNPGAMWRFLAFEETDKLVTLVDADRAARPLPDIIRTETTAKAGLGFWRVPVWGELNDEGNLNYRPIVGCQMGCTKMLPTRLLMEALIWQTRRGGIRTTATPPGALAVTVHGSVWPDYGFDEWFLQTALYPRAAFEGLLTFVPASAKSQLLPLDIEFTMWANPASEIQYFGRNDGLCCAPTPAGAKEEAARLVIVRPDCTVLPVEGGRSRRKQRTLQFADPQPQRMKLRGSLLKVLSAAADSARTGWLAVISPDLTPGEGGAELFLDRTVEPCDMAHSGYAFLTVTAEVADWARRRNLDPERWSEGQPVKHPRPGPLTLWKVDSLRSILKEFQSEGEGIPLELFLAAWAALGKIKLVSVSTTAQGWNAG